MNPSAHSDDRRAVQLYDTTLREGTDREGLSLSAANKIRIARMLDDLGVAFVELGRPGSNPRDVEVFERARDMPWRHATLSAFGATRRAGIAPADDPQVRALLAAGTPVCAIFGQTSIVHVREVLRVSPVENLRMITETVGWLAENGRRVVYDAEHFFDGYTVDAEYAIETLWAAARAGAEMLVLCDTNGATLPWVISQRVLAITRALERPIGIRAHDGTGCAVAASLAAVRAGAVHVQGTLDGRGERCGGANLCTIASALELKMRRRCLSPGALAQLTHVVRRVAEFSNLAPAADVPQVDRSAFTHTSGVHVAAIPRHERACEPIDAALVDNETRVGVSEPSGRGNGPSHAEDQGVALGAGDEHAVLPSMKDREARDDAFDAAEASAALMMRRQTPGYEAPFTLVDYKVIVGQREGEAPFADALVKIRVRGETVRTEAEGNGPVSALDAALRKALAGTYPEVCSIRLAGYKVRILDGEAGTSATVRVLVDSACGNETWTTVGASSNVLEATWHAIAHGIEYGLARVAENGAAA
jgi:2-isopropylmalate synthase